MRLSVSLDPDVYAVVRALAKEQDQSLSRALNELVRRGLDPRASMEGSGNRGRKEDDLPVIAGGKTFTSEDVYRLEAECP